MARQSGHRCRMQCHGNTVRDTNPHSDSVAVAVQAFDIGSLFSPPFRRMFTYMVIDPAEFEYLTAFEERQGIPETPATH